MPLTETGRPSTIANRWVIRPPLRSSDHQRLLVVEDDVGQRVVVPLQPGRGRRAATAARPRRDTRLRGDRRRPPGRCRGAAAGRRPARPVRPVARVQVDVRVAQLQRLGDDEVLAWSNPRGPCRSAGRFDHCDSCRHMRKYSRASSQQLVGVVRVAGRHRRSPARPGRTRRAGSRPSHAARCVGPRGVPGVVGQPVVVARRRGVRQPPLLLDVRVAGAHQVQLADDVVVGQVVRGHDLHPRVGRRSTTAPPGSGSCTGGAGVVAPVEPAVTAGLVRVVAVDEQVARVHRRLRWPAPGTCAGWTARACRGPRCRRRRRTGRPSSRGR